MKELLVNLSQYYLITCLVTRRLSLLCTPAMDVGDIMRILHKEQFSHFGFLFCMRKCEGQHCHGEKYEQKIVLFMSSFLGII